MNRFECSRITLASSFPVECRIPHLENNTYIYGGGKPNIPPVPVYQPLKSSVGETYQKGAFEIEPFAGDNGFKPAVQERGKIRYEDAGLELKRNSVFDNKTKIPVCSGAQGKLLIEFPKPDNKLNNAYIKNPPKSEPATPIHRSKSCESSKKQENNPRSLNEKPYEPAIFNNKPDEINIKPEFKKKNEVNFESNHKLTRSFSTFSERNSVLSKHFEVGSPIERVSSMNSASVINEMKEMSAKNDSLALERKETDHKNFIVKQTSLKSEGISSRQMIVRENSMKSEANSNRNSFFSGNTAKNEGKLTRGELESMEIHSILRKNGKNAEKSGKTIENHIETVKEKIDANKAESERKAVQAALIEDYRRESLRRELSRQGSFKAKAPTEDLSATSKIQALNRKNPEIFNPSKTVLRKTSETFEYSSESSIKNSSKQRSSHSKTNSPSEHITSSSNPSFSSQKPSDYNRVTTMPKADLKLSKSYSIYNSKSRRNSLPPKESDNKYHESTFTYKLKYMDKQPYTYLPGAKSQKSFPQFIFKLNHI